MYRDEVTVPRYQKFIGDVVSTCGRYVSGFACVSVRQCFIESAKTGAGQAVSAILFISEWLENKSESSGTKVTNIKGTLRVYWPGSPATPRAGDRTRAVTSHPRL